MWRFEERKKKQYLECLGPGPHVTKNGSRWLVAGFHSYVQIEDGTVRCQKCAEARKKPIIREPYRPSYAPELTDKEREELRAGLANIREAVEKMEKRPTQIKEDERSREQTPRQREL